VTWRDAWPVAPNCTACSSGSPNAAVLPEPVCAMPSRSLPSRMAGIASVWMGVGSVKPAAWAAWARAGERPRAAKGMGKAACARGTAAN